MKKFLFGICALALSASAFGAIMSTDTIDGKSDTAVALPIKLEANIIEGSNKLFIEGTSGDVFGDVLSLNFGDLARGQIGRAEGRVRVFRGDNWDTAGSTFKPTELGANVGFSFLINGEDTGTDAGINQYYLLTMTSVNVGEAVDDNVIDGNEIAKHTFKAGIALTGVSFDGDDMASSTRIDAKVAAQTEPILNTQTVGKYYGAVSMVATLGAEAKQVQPLP